LILNAQISLTQERSTGKDRANPRSRRLRDADMHSAE